MSDVKQSGQVTPGHLATWDTTGVLGDAGPWGNISGNLISGYIPIATGGSTAAWGNNLISAVQFFPQLTLTNATAVAGDSGPYIIFQRSNPIASGDTVAGPLWQGWANGGYQNMADISSDAASDPVGSLIPSIVIIKTTSAFGPALGNFFKFDQNGNFEAPAGLYGTNVGVGTTNPQTNLQVVGTNPTIAVTDSGSSANQKTWDWIATSNVLQGRAVNDAYNSATAWISVARSGASPTGVTIVPNVTFNGAISSTSWFIDSGGDAGFQTLLTRQPNTQTGSTYAVATNDSSIIANASGTMTLTLPAASAYAGRWLQIKTIANQAVISNASNVVPLNSATPGTALLAATAGKWAFLQSDGSNWIIMAGN